MRRFRFLAPLLAAWLLTGCPGTEVDENDDDSTEPAPDPDDPPELSVRYDPLGLTDSATDALALAPTWLQDDLAINLGRVEDEVQDDLAEVLLGLDDPYLTDEVAFAIAHTSPEVLEYWGFHPELFEVNARYIYLADPSLEYVQLEEVGEPGVDEDYYTTATYRIREEDGSVVERTLDRDVYYWYVVHPRLEDEPPFFIDGWVNDQPAEPEDGYFWREFLWERAVEECPADERECPILDGWMDGIDVLWEGKTSAYEEVSAIGRVYAFVWTAIHWGAGDERPVQPVRIYTVGCGNCGEHADLGSSAARTALIPAQNVGARSNDHTWDEFWDERWIDFDVTGSGMNWMGNYKNGVGRDLIDGDPVEASVTLDVQVESYRVEADGAYYGSMSVEHEGGRVDVLVVDEDNYDLFKDEEPFDAQYAVLDVGSAGSDLGAATRAQVDGDPGQPGHGGLDHGGQRAAGGRAAGGVRLDGRGGAPGDPLPDPAGEVLLAQDRPLSRSSRTRPPTGRRATLPSSSCTPRAKATEAKPWASTASTGGI